MSKRAEEAALKAYPPETKKAIELLPRDWNKPKRTAFIQGYEQAEKDVWNKIEKYLSKRYSSDFATVGWILKNIEEYKKKIMEEE